MNSHTVERIALIGAGNCHEIGSRCKHEFKSKWITLFLVNLFLYPRSNSLLRCIGQIIQVHPKLSARRTTYSQVINIIRGVERIKLCVILNYNLIVFPTKVFSIHVDRIICRSARNTCDLIKATWKEKYLKEALTVSSG